MIKLRLQTSNERKQLIVDPSVQPMDILNENEVILEGASVNLNGIQLTRQEFTQPLIDLLPPNTESATLSVVVKTGNA